jgi:hypothetical protein
MRALPLATLLACGAPDPSDPASSGDTAWVPQDSWSSEPVEAPLVLLDGLDTPHGLALDAGVLWIAEAGAGRIWRHDGSDGAVAHEGLDTPSWIAAGTGAVFAVDGEAVVRLEGEAQTAVADGLLDPHALRIASEHIWWVEAGDGRNGAIWRAGVDGSDAQTVADALETPRGLAVIGGRALKHWRPSAAPSGMWPPTAKTCSSSRSRAGGHIPARSPP